MIPFPYTSVQLRHLGRFINQKLIKIKVGIVGGYHGGNLGDIALGLSVLQALKDQNIKSGLQTVYNLDRWPNTDYAILGGGAVGYADNLARISVRFKNRMNRVALLGVDFNEPRYAEKNLDVIRSAAYVSARSQAQAEKLIMMSGRTDIQFHPDIAFSLYRNFCAKQRKARDGVRTKKLLVNVLPLYGEVVNGSIICDEQYRSERPAIYQSFDLMHQTYRKVVRRIVEQAIFDGYIVETIPFTPEDGAYGRLILEGLDVKHSKYHSDPLKMVMKMATASKILATRYHTTIFSLKLGIPTYPVAYAIKNELLLEELGIGRSEFITTDDLALGKDDVLLPISVDSAVISSWEAESAKVIKDCIASLNI